MTVYTRDSNYETDEIHYSNLLQRNLVQLFYNGLPIK